MTDDISGADYSADASQQLKFENSFLRASGPIPPPDSCPIGLQPAALTPVFYGVRDYSSTNGAPLNLRVFFPSLDGSVFDAPILKGCGRYPLLLFAHGDCQAAAEHYKKWFILPAQLARAGYIVAVPELPNISTHPSQEDHPALAALADTQSWIRSEWEHREVIMPAAATGIIGHSFGALLSARFAKSNEIAAFASLSGVWEDWPGGPAGPVPIIGLNLPMLFIWGEADLFVRISDSVWNSLAIPRYRAIFSEGLHWDYLPPGSTPCDNERGPCPYLAPATVDYVTMFFGKYLPPEFAPQLPDQISNIFIPPALVLTFEQEFYAGGYLNGVRMLSGRQECHVTVTSVTVDTRTVPFVRFVPEAVAAMRVRSVDLVPAFTGPSGRGSWVFSQSPSPGNIVPKGSTVRMVLKSGSIP